MGRTRHANGQAVDSLLAACPVALALVQPDGAVETMNGPAAELLARAAPGRVQANLFEAYAEQAQELAVLVQQSGGTIGPICQNHRIYLNRGRSEQSRTAYSASLSQLGDGRILALLADISTQAETEEKLSRYEAWAAALASGASDHAAVTLDESGRIAAWSEAAERLLGYGAPAVLGRHYGCFYPAGSTTPERLQDALGHARREGWLLEEGWRSRADGGRFFCSSMLTPLAGPAPGFLYVLRDLSDRQVQIAEASRLARNDHLTGIANRATFYEVLSQEEARWRRYRRPLSLLVVDADRFKSINDTYGHAGGDRVLVNFAARARAMVRDVDLAARPGGEEFGIMLPATPLSGALVLAERLRRDIEAQSVDVGGTLIRYTVSIGAAEFGDRHDNHEAVLRAADEALYVAKNAGRNRVAAAATESIPPVRKATRERAR